MINYFKLKDELTLDDIYKILKYFEGNPKKYSNYIISRTICHSGKSHKLYYYNNSKLFKCYTECPEETFDIFTLIKKIYNLQNKDISYSQIYNLINRILKRNFTYFEIPQKNEININYKIQENLLNLEYNNNSEYEFKIYDENILNYIDDVFVSDWADEGIKYFTQKKFNIKFLPTTGQIIIPHYDINNHLIGVRGRFLNDFDCLEYGKYRPISYCGQTYSHPLSLNLYGLNFNYQNIMKTKKAIIFESEKSVMMYDSWFGSDNNISVACCGSSVSIHQINLLLNLGVTEIIIGLDKQFENNYNKEFQKYLNNICKIANKIINFCNISVIFDNLNLLDYKDSPIDKGKDVFTKLFNNRITMNPKIIKEVLEWNGN